ncbi:MAG: SPOR domain-containing protein [Micropepsaceae bacterium]
MTMTDRGAFDQAEYDRRFHGDFMYDATLEDEEGTSARSPLFIILTALVLTAFGAVVYVAYQQGRTQGDRGTPPVITAEAGPIKVQPENPGGVEVPDQDKLIYERIAGASPEPTEGGLAAPPEVPQDIPAAAPEIEAGSVPLETPGDVEAGDTTLMAADVANAEPSAEQVAAEKAAKQQAAAITSQIEEIDPGAADAAAATAAATTGAFVVQIGAFKEDAEAAGQWQAFKKKNADLTGALKPDIKRVDLGGKGVWYRLRVGPFETKQNAVAFCEVLRTRGGQCNVTAP